MMWGLEHWGREAIPHVAAGAVSPATCYVHPVLAVLAWLGYMVYQVQEYLQIRDKAWRDINQFVVGFFVTSVVLLIAITFGGVSPP